MSSVGAAVRAEEGGSVRPIRISVVIPTYQRRERVLAALEALERQSFDQAFEVVVAVDGSTDGTAEALRARSTTFPLTVIEQPNAGVAAARNFGARSARGEILLFLDDDMEADPDLLAEHDRTHREGADAVLGHLPLHPKAPANVLSDGVAIWVNGRLARLSAPDAVLRLDDLIGGQMSVSRESFRSIQGFDPQFSRAGVYGDEDIDLGYRLLKGRFDIRFNPQAVSYQYYMVTPGEHLRQWHQAGHADLLFARKHPEQALAMFRGHDLYAPFVKWVARPVSRLPFWRLITWPARRLGRWSGARSGVLAQWLFYRARDLEYWRGVHEAGGIPWHRELRVLAYHALSNLKGRPTLEAYGIPLDTFGAQIAALKARGFQFISVAEFTAFAEGRAGLPRRAVLVTFDDCYRDLKEAAPILAAEGIGAIAFAVSGLIGKDNAWDRQYGGPPLPLLDKAGLTELRQAGVEIGAHSQSHPILPQLAPAEIATEIAGSVQDLEDAGLGRPRFFAYPYGESDGRVRDIAERAGLTAAFIIDPGVMVEATDPMLIPRVEILSSDVGIRFLAKVAFARELGWWRRCTRALGGVRRRLSARGKRHSRSDPGPGVPRAAERASAEHANALLQQGRLEDAEAAFASLAVARPDDPAGPAGLARCAARGKNWPLAEARWRRVLTDRPDNAGACDGLGYALLEQGRIEEAEAEFARLAAALPDQPTGLVGLARCALRGGNRRLAEERWRKVLASRPDHAGALEGLANAIVQQHRLQDAEAAFARLAAAHPDKPNGLIGLARCAVERKDWPLAEESWRKVLAGWPKNAAALGGLGHALLEQGRIQDAEQSFGRFAEAYPNRAESQVGLARCAVRREHWRLAEQRWRKALAMSPDHAGALHGLAEVLVQRRHFRRARRAFARLARAHPDEPTGLAGLARCAARTSDWRQTERCWRSVVARWPKHPGALEGLARALQRRGRIEEAKAVFARLAAAHPGDPKWLATVASCAAEAEDPRPVQEARLAVQRRLRPVLRKTQSLAESLFASRLARFPPKREAPRRVPRIGRVDFGDLGEPRPISRDFGYGRGSPIDRYYIERFLAGHRNSVQGRVLEVGDDDYSRRFGGARIVRQDILHVHPGNPRATLVGELGDPDVLPASAFDCIILTQTLHLIFDMRAALACLHAALKPGGVLLLTTPGITQVDRDEWGSCWFWSMTPASAGRLIGEVFGPDSVTVECYGNVLAATALLYGLACEEMDTAKLDKLDEAYPVTVAVRAVKGGG